MKADLEVMDALIESLYEELSNISYGWFEAQRSLNRFDLQYELLKKEMKKGEQPADWIPCSERLPKQEEQVFVYLFGNSPYIAWYNHINKKWRTDDFELDADEEPKAWLPLPMLRWGE